MTEDRTDNKKRAVAIWRFWPQSLLGRLLAVVCYVVVGGNLAILTVLYNQSAANVERHQRLMLQAIVVPLAQQIDGDLHEMVVAQYPKAEEISNWDLASGEAQYLHQQLAQVARILRLSVPITTIRLKPSRADEVYSSYEEAHIGAYESVLSSDKDFVWRSELDYHPRMARSQFASRSYASGVYADSDGRWIAAYGPILNSQGEVVALIQARSPIDDLIHEVRLQTVQQASLIGFIVAVMLLGIAYITERLGRDLNQIEKAAEMLGKGSFYKEIVVSGGVEVQRLASSLEVARKRLLKNSLILGKMRNDFEKRVEFVRLGFEFSGGRRRDMVKRELVEMSFALTDGNGKSVAGEIVDMNGPIWSFLVTDPVFKLWFSGMRLCVRVAATLRRPEVSLVACVVSVYPASNGAFVHVRLEQERFQEFLSPAVLKVFDRRENIRVVPQRDEGPSCTLITHTTGERHEVYIRDICRTGVGVNVERTAEEISRWGPILHAIFRLPDGASEKVPMAVKYILDFGESTQVGLEFDDAFLREVGTPSLLRYLAAEERLQQR